MSDGMTEFCKHRIRTVECSQCCPAEPDIIDHPPHYQGKVECIDAIESALTPEQFEGYCRAAAMKYIWRAGKKDDKVTDIRKAIWYLDRLIGGAK